ncbi:MAG: hypothetical protein QM778_17055 [Myxococcales bacterium]
MRPREFLNALENPQAPKCTASGEQAEMLRTLLVHLFFIDRDLDQGELSMLGRVLPEVNLREYIQGAAARRLDLDRLAALFPDSGDRDDIITLAEHAVWGDNHVERGEWELVERLMERLGVVRD